MYFDGGVIESSIRVLVLGLRGEDHERDNFSIGTQVEEIIRSLHVPILLVNQEFKTPQKVLIAYDGSPSSKKALAMVLNEPLFAKIERHIVYVHHDKEASEKLLNEACALLGESALHKSVFVSLQGEPVAALLAYQEKQGIDLMAMGAFSHSRLRDALLGSFTAKILSQTQKPLLLLR
ncbi:MULTISPECIES: universal stress protein, partial [unclassified Sulfurospirillum]|uniref:universal stress protein n=1 Tax=unclassified Sulfurospirillum TaxID=2618290 RepID=UPI000506989B